MPYTDPTPEATPETERLNRATRILGAFYIAVPFVLIYLLFKIFPPNPWPPEPWVPMSFLFKFITVWTTQEERLILLVIVAGALGSYIHSATSYSDYRGNRQFSSSWMLWYLLRPFIGICLALIVYFAVRGGLLSMVLSGETANNAANINPFGVAAISGLTGMFSKQAADKLAEVFSTLFKSGGDSARKDALNVSTVITSIDPDEGPVDGGTRITITGTGFGDEAKVLFAGKPAVNVQVVSGTSITLDTPPGELGSVDVEVQNADGKTHTKANGFTYTAASTNSEENPDAATDSATNDNGAAGSGSATTAGGGASEGEHAGRGFERGSSPHDQQ